jgi:hypothetical protein
MMRLTMVLLIVLSVSRPLTAQSVAGRVIDAQSGSPIAAAFVTLVDTAGESVSQMLADTLGQFKLRPTAEGTFTLRVQRIGYAQYDSEPFVISGDVAHSVRVPPLPIQLPSVTTAEDGGCARGAAVDPAVLVLWEEVRKALTITSWTAQNVLIEFVWEDRRTSDRPGSTDMVTRSAGILTGTPFAAMPEDSLLEKGFIQKGTVGWVFFGPDAQLIMSDDFQKTHCLRIVDDPEHNMVGLNFASTDAGPEYDVDGTLWLDRATGRLSHLSFSYSELPFTVPRGNTAGGRVDFRMLDNGTWIVSAWSIRAPTRNSNGPVFWNERAQRILRATSGGRVLYDAKAPT